MHSKCVRLQMFSTKNGHNDTLNVRLRAIITETNIHVIMVKLHDTTELNTCLGSPYYPPYPLDMRVFGYPASRYASSLPHFSTECMSVFSPTFTQHGGSCLTVRDLSL